MRVRPTSWIWVAVAVLALAGGARAIEGDLAPETREKLARRVTIEEEAIPLAEFAMRVADQTGLSFVASAHVAHMPEPVAVVARDVPAGELLDAVAFSMDLEFKITPGGVIAIRLDHEDPRREAMIERAFWPDEDRGGEGEEPAIGEDEIVERVADDPKVRDVLDKLDGRLVPAKFHPEKRVWILIVRREGERGPPLAHVVATEDGDVLDIKVRGGEGGPEKGRKDKRFEKGRKGKRQERKADEERFRGDEAREREGRENF